MRILIRGFGELCITAGLILLLFVTYELWGTGQYTEKQQDELGEQLTRDWGTTERVRLGRGMALLRIPRLGDDYKYVVIEGVGPEDLRKGPGHYPGTALPGQLGNFVVSGHRTTYSAPFNRVNELRAGDRILVDTRTEQLIYSVTGQEIVAPSAIAVTSPVPFHPKQAANKRLITLTTCHPKFSAAKRLIIFGELTQRRPRMAPGGTPSNASGGI